MTQSPTTDLVIGYVEKFSHDRGFGFVNAFGRDGTVFIHEGNCRAFAGVPGKPEIPDERLPNGWLAKDDNLVAAFPGRRTDYSYVVMEVVEGPKGPKARRWAVIPRRRSVEDILNMGGLDSFIGMEVGIMPVSTKVAGGTWGVLESWTLTETRIELTLSSAHGSGIEPAQYGTVTRVYVFDHLRVTSDAPHSNLTLRLIWDGDEPTLQVVCWQQLLQ